MGYDDISPEPHGAFCKFLSGPEDRKQALMPRSFVKTWIGTIAYSVWVTLPREIPDEFPYQGAWDDKFWQLGPNMRILIASYVISNAEKMISLIRKTYESNVAMQMLYPEVIPYNFNKVRWSNASACINRTEDATESTFEAAGIGGSSTSRHYDMIIEDDLIYASKDDFSGKELQPNQEDIDKAIGWHKLGMSLLVPGKHTRIHNTGTRWAQHDLVDYIYKHEPDYAKFKRACVNVEQLESGVPWNECDPTWPECYPHSQLQKIRNAQGQYMFSTQYLLKPSAPEDKMFKLSWLQYYTLESEIPKECRMFTTVDLSQWTPNKRKTTECQGVVLTCGWDSNNHVWIKHYDVGRFNPTEIIYLMAKHWKLFQPEMIGVEEVLYQKSIEHFAREYIAEGKVPWMNIRGIKPEGNINKDLRIAAIEPLASMLGVHCRPDHTEFKEEFEDFQIAKPCLKDILDCLAYQVQIARPGIIETPEVAEEDRHKDYKFEVTIDDVLKALQDSSNPKDTFGNSQIVAKPFEGDQMLVDVTNPFSGDQFWLS